MEVDNFPGFGGTGEGSLEPCGLDGVGSDTIWFLRITVQDEEVNGSFNVIIIALIARKVKVIEVRTCANTACTRKGCDAPIPPVVVTQRREETGIGKRSPDEISVVFVNIGVNGGLFSGRVIVIP